MSVNIYTLGKVGREQIARQMSGDTRPVTTEKESYYRQAIANLRSIKPAQSGLFDLDGAAA